MSAYEKARGRLRDEGFHINDRFNDFRILVHVATEYLALHSLDFLRLLCLEGALIKFVVVHGLLHADLVLKQEVDQGLAVDQSDRPVNGSRLLLADPENPTLKVSDLSFLIR